MSRGHATNTLSGAATHYRRITNAHARVSAVAFASFVSGLLSLPLAAQAPPDSSWLERLRPALVAGIFARPVSLSIDDVESDPGTGLYAEFGLRLSPIASLCGAKRNTVCRITSPITLTPQVSLGATQLLGIQPTAGASSFSTAELMGLRVAYPIGRRIVPFVKFGSGTHSSEQFENGEIVNLWGTGSSRSAGVELPLTRLGRGISIAVTQHRGRFVSIETLDTQNNVKVLGPADRPYTAFSWQVGWSGPFTGVTWPWQ